MENQISIIGAGSWGTALAILLSKKGYNVKLWVRQPELQNIISTARENITYLPGVILPSNIEASVDIEYCCHESEAIIIATPSHIVREIAGKIKPYIKKEQVIVNLAKGIENETLMRMSQIIDEILPENHNAILTGPSHAEEVARDIPTAVVVSSQKREIAEKVQDIFMSPRLRVYTNPDLVGVELGGALKNVIALGAGIVDGLEFGDNTRSALMTRGIVEMARLGESMGASSLTFGGLAGIGDLIVTCTSMHSRNRKAGIAIGQGKSLEEIMSGTKMVIEGVRTTKSAYQLAQKQGIEMPITEEIYDVLYNNAEIKNSVINLMMRSKTHEQEDIAGISSRTWS